MSRAVNRTVAASCHHHKGTSTSRAPNPRNTDTSNGENALSADFWKTTEPPHTIAAVVSARYASMAERGGTADSGSVAVRISIMVALKKWTGYFSWSLWSHA